MNLKLKFELGDIARGLILLAIAYITLFSHIETLPIRLYDEARLANNAYEMLNDGDFVVTHFDSKPDMWNTKPPYDLESGSLHETFWR